MDRLAPGLRRLVERRTGTSLYVGADLRSVRGVELVPDLERLDLPSGIGLGPVGRAPGLRVLHLWERPRSRPVRLGPLASAPALEELHLHGVRVVETEALARIATLRVVEVSFGPSPDLRPLARLPLRRLVLDGVSGVRLRDLRGLAVEQLDLWGCDVADLAPLATMPSLREVWVHVDAWRKPRWAAHGLAPFLHLRPGAQLVLDGSLDPDLHRADIARLEDRGVWLFVGREPHENGVHPSWWGPFFPKSRTESPEPPRYVTARPQPEYEPDGP